MHLFCQVAEVGKIGLIILLLLLLFTAIVTCFYKDCTSPYSLL